MRRAGQYDSRDWLLMFTGALGLTFGAMGAVYAFQRRDLFLSGLAGVLLALGGMITVAYVVEYVGVRRRKRRYEKARRGFQKGRHG